MDPSAGSEAVFLSVCAPAYNEEATIEQVVRAWAEVLEASGQRGEIIIGNDGSTDPMRRPYIDVTIIPEPATMGLLGLGLAGLAAIRRRRK